VRFFLNILDEDRHCLDDLDLNLAVFEGQESREVTHTDIFLNKLLKVD